MTPETAELGALVDGTGMSGFQWRIVLACAAIALIDGFDNQTIGLVAPDIAKAWHVVPASFGPVFGAGLFGGLIGGLLFGSMCDRFGRKPSLLLAMIIFGCGSLATPWSASLPTLLAMRLFTGFGLGGALPCVIALTSEYVPDRMRTQMVGWMFCGFPLGAVAAGIVAALLLPHAGWQSMFVIGGVMPLLLVPILWRTMPESIRFLALRGRRLEIERVLTRMRRSHRWNGDIALPPATARLPIAEMFTEGRAAGTLSIWLTLFLSLVMAYFLLNWLPLVARQSGIGAAAAALGIASLNLGTIAGCLALAPLAAKRPGKVIAGGYVAGAVAIASIGQSGGSTLALLTTTFLAGFFATGAQFCTIALGAAFYDTRLRATGVGWSMGMGRVGGVLGPVIGGLLLAAGLGVPYLFGLTGLVALAAALGALVAGRMIERARKPVA